MKRASFFELTEEYPSEASAEKYFTDLRWPGGRITCPECGSDNVIRGRQKKRRRQLWYCRNPDCKKMFSVTSGTIMNSTKLTLRKWLFAYHLIGSSKKGISALQLSRMLRISYKAAWHLSHRIRETMGIPVERFSGVVETDEVYIGGRKKGHGKGYRKNKVAVQTIIQRNDPDEHNSKARTISLNRPEVDGRSLGAKLRTHTDPDNTILMTDQSAAYTRVGKSFAEHHTVNHNKEEYVRVEDDGLVVTTNSAEGLFSNMKRQINGTHHHVSKKHLPRYLQEFDHKFNERTKSDTEITEDAIRNIEGKRLTLYKSQSGRGESLYDHKVKVKATRPGPESEASESEPGKPDG